MDVLLWAAAVIWSTATVVWTLGPTPPEADSFPQADKVLHALAYATRDRKQRKRQFRALWIVRINAAARLNGTTYSKLTAALKKAGVIVDRKILADLALSAPGDFAAVVKAASA